jgi:hypothetical protein
LARFWYRAATALNVSAEVNLVAISAPDSERGEKKHFF